MTTNDKIKKYLQKKGRVTGNELANILGLTDRAIRKQLFNLLKRGEVSKLGRPPKVYYFLSGGKTTPVPDGKIDSQTTDYINENYLYISPGGNRLTGMKGFEAWCLKTKQPLIKTAKDYIETLNKYYLLRKNGLINGMPKMKHTFTDVGLDDLFYLDFYSIDRFGKTKLGQLLLYAKQSQNKLLMKELVANVRPRVKSIVKKYRITSVGYIPPTVRREVQLMRVLEQELKLNLIKLSIIKVKTEVAVPQKTLTKLEDRIENAKDTIVVDDRRVHDNVLLIDDAVGSGSTLNETALQIKSKGICKGKIIGLAITGSYKGFDVISEV